MRAATGTWLVLLATVIATTEATAAHITDKLLAGFYAQPATEAQPLRVLPSGTPIEVLERKGEYTRVRLSDSSEGWVQSMYITDQKPAQVMLLEAQARAAALEQELARLKAPPTPADAGERAAEPTPPAPTASPHATEAAAANNRYTWPWLLVLAGCMFGAGLTSGMALVSYRLRKRFGGLRL